MEKSKRIFPLEVYTVVSQANKTRKYVCHQTKVKIFIELQSAALTNRAVPCAIYRKRVKLFKIIQFHELLNICKLFGLIT